jgi:hypothetical protein
VPQARLVHGLDPKVPLLEGGGSATALTDYLNPRVGDSVKPPKEVVHRNTRITVGSRYVRCYVPGSWSSPSCSVMSLKADYPSRDSLFRRQALQQRRNCCKEDMGSLLYGS